MKERANNKTFIGMSNTTSKRRDRRFIGQQLKDIAIKIADFWEKKGIYNPTID